MRFLRFTLVGFLFIHLHARVHGQYADDDGQGQRTTTTTTTTHTSTTNTIIRAFLGARLGGKVTNVEELMETLITNLAARVNGVEIENKKVFHALLHPVPDTGNTRITTAAYHNGGHTTPTTTITHTTTTNTIYPALQHGMSDVEELLEQQIQALAARVEGVEIENKKLRAAVSFSDTSQGGNDRDDGGFPFDDDGTATHTATATSTHTTTTNTINQALRSLPRMSAIQELLVQQISIFTARVNGVEIENKKLRAVLPTTTQYCDSNNDCFRCVRCPQFDDVLKGLVGCKRGCTPTAMVICSAGEYRIGYSNECAECPTGTFQWRTSHTQTKCVKVNGCPPYQFQVRGATKRANTRCASSQPCGRTQYVTVAEHPI